MHESRKHHHHSMFPLSQSYIPKSTGYWDEEPTKPRTCVPMIKAALEFMKKDSFEVGSKHTVWLYTLFYTKHCITSPHSPSHITTPPHTSPHPLTHHHTPSHITTPLKHHRTPSHINTLPLIHHHTALAASLSPCTPHRRSHSYRCTDESELTLN